MDAVRFDAVVRALSKRSFRRDVLSGLAAFAVWPLALPAVAAKNGENEKRKRRKKRRQKRKNKQPPFNEYGCLDVGQQCRGNSDLCGSSVCEGKKPKKGEKDKSTCVVHDTGGCQAGQRQEVCGGATDVPCTATGGEEGVCNTTTGNAAFCTVDGGCFACTKDADCQAVCGPAAACIPCEGFCADGVDTFCVGPSRCPVELPD